MSDQKKEQTYSDIVHQAISLAESSGGLVMALGMRMAPIESMPVYSATELVKSAQDFRNLAKQLEGMASRILEIDLQSKKVIKVASIVDRYGKDV